VSAEEVRHSEDLIFGVWRSQRATFTASVCVGSVGISRREENADLGFSVIHDARYLPPTLSSNDSFSMVVPASPK